MTTRVSRYKVGVVDLNCIRVVKSPVLDLHINSLHLPYRVVSQYGGLDMIKTRDPKVKKWVLVATK